MRKYLLLTAIVILMADVFTARAQLRVNASAEEYAVYSALIANMFAGEKVTFDSQARIKLLVIQDSTATDTTTGRHFVQDDQYFKTMFPTLTEGVVKDYTARNKQSVRLVNVFALNVKYVLVDKREFEKILEGGGWEEFYKRYPDSGGFIILSRVGLNAAMNQALVYIQHWCGGLCGTGHYALLEKSEDRWRVVKRSMVWIS